MSGLMILMHTFHWTIQWLINTILVTSESRIVRCMCVWVLVCNMFSQYRFLTVLILTLTQRILWQNDSIGQSVPVYHNFLKIEHNLSNIVVQSNSIDIKCQARLYSIHRIHSYEHGYVRERIMHLFIMRTFSKIVFSHLTFSFIISSNIYGCAVKRCINWNATCAAVHTCVWFR